MLPGNTASSDSASLLRVCSTLAGVELTWICELVSDDACCIHMRIARDVSNNALSIVPVSLLALASGQS